jgi:hypothetical protein
MMTATRTATYLLMKTRLMFWLATLMRKGA